MKVKNVVGVTPVLLLSLILFAALPAAGQLLVIGGGGKYQHIVRVAPSGAPFTSIQAAIDSITDESASNRYLVTVAPGTYAESVTMTDWISLRGSGQRGTIITAPGSNNTADATLHGANNSEISHLTVQNTGGGGYTYAKAVENNAYSPLINQVEVLVAAARGQPGLRHHERQWRPAGYDRCFLRRVRGITGQLRHPQHRREQQPHHVAGEGRG